MSMVLDESKVVSDNPKPAMCPLSGKVKTYKIRRGSFGGYPKGKVLPKHTLVRVAGGGIDKVNEDSLVWGMVKSGQFEEVYEDVNVELVVPEAKTPTDASPDLVKDVNKANAKLRSLEQDLITISADRDGWKSQVASRDKALGEQAGQIAELQASIAARDELAENIRIEMVAMNAKNAELTGQLDVATKPADGKKVSK